MKKTGGLMTLSAKVTMNKNLMKADQDALEGIY